MLDEHLPFVWSGIDDYGLTSEEFRVLHRISRRGECTESAANMSTALLICERTIRMCFRVLSDVGAITETERIGCTTLRKAVVFERWEDKSALLQARQQVKAKWKPKPTPAPVAPLQEIQPSPARDTGGAAPVAAKGNPSKTIQLRNTEAAVKSPRRTDELFELLAAICRIDYKVCTGEQRHQLNQSLKILRGVDVTKEQLTAAGFYWYEQDWRGKQRPPKPSEIREDWDVAKSYVPVAERAKKVAF